MRILEQGCTCNNCMNITLENLKEAREKWENGERNIVFKPYHYPDEYGTHVYVNGFQIITSDGENIEHVLENLMEFLEVDNVNIEYEYEDEGE